MLQNPQALKDEMGKDEMVRFEVPALGMIWEYSEEEEEEESRDGAREDRPRKRGSRITH